MLNTEDKRKMSNALLLRFHLLPLHHHLFFHSFSVFAMSTLCPAPWPSSLLFHAGLLSIYFFSNDGCIQSSSLFYFIVPLCDLIEF